LRRFWRTAFSSIGNGANRNGMSDFAALPPKDRAKRYRALAVQARSEAEAADSRLREAYILMAEKWERLAQGAEDESGGG
jgi:hypothetical protein